MSNSGAEDSKTYTSLDIRMVVGLVYQRHVAVFEFNTEVCPSSQMTQTSQQDKFFTFIKLPYPYIYNFHTGTYLLPKVASLSSLTFTLAIFCHPFFLGGGGTKRKINHVTGDLFQKFYHSHTYQFREA